MTDIGERIRYLRKLHNLSMNKLGKEIGISSGNISDWETGRSNPSIRGLIAISDYFGVSIDWLIRGENWEKLNSQERKLIHLFQKLNPQKQKEVLQLLEKLAAEL